MWSSIFLASSAIQARAAAPKMTPKETPVLTERERLQFLNDLPRIKSLSSENYTNNCNAVLEHARPRGASSSIYYLHKHKLMGMKNGQFLFDIVVRSEHPMSTAIQIHGFINHASLKSNDSDYEIKIQRFMNQANGVKEAEPSASAEKEADAVPSDDEESAAGFVLV